MVAERYMMHSLQLECVGMLVKRLNTEDMSTIVRALALAASVSNTVSDDTGAQHTADTAQVPSVKRAPQVRIHHHMQFLHTMKTICVDGECSMSAIYICVLVTSQSVSNKNVVLWLWDTPLAHRG